MGDVSWKINTSENQYVGNKLGPKDENKIWKENFYFVIGADPQFGFFHMKHSIEYPDAKKKCTWEDEIKLTEIAVQKINKLNPKPKFFIVCGDLTNEYPECNAQIKSEQIASFKKIFSQVDSDIPLLCVCGNHDVGDAATPESISRYRSEFGDDYYSFWCGGIFFIVYNSQYFKEPEFIVELAAEHEKWFDEQLAKAVNCRIVLIGHIPWFWTILDEEDNIYNITLDLRKKMMKKLHDAGVRYMFFGHRHRNEFASYKDMELVITTSMTLDLGGGSPGLRIAMVRQKDIIHRAYTYDEFPDSVDLKSGLL